MGQLHALRRHSIEVGRPNRGVAVAAKVAIPQVIAEDHYEVWFVVGGARRVSNVLFATDGVASTVADATRDSHDQMPNSSTLCAEYATTANAVGAWRATATTSRALHRG